jgi:hypothetical protein
MKCRTWAVALWCGLVLALAVPGSAAKYVIVQDALGDCYLIDASDPYWSKIKDPVTYFRTHRMIRRPPGFGGHLNPKDMSKAPSTQQQVQETTYKVGTGLSKVPLVGRFAQRINTWSQAPPVERVN